MLSDGYEEERATMSGNTEFENRALETKYVEEEDGGGKW